LRENRLPNLLIHNLDLLVDHPAGEAIDRDDIRAHGKDERIRVDGNRVFTQYNRGAGEWSPEIELAPYTHSEIGLAAGESGIAPNPTSGMHKEKAVK